MWNPLNNEIPLKTKLLIGDNKWIKSLRFFNGEYDKEEGETKKSLKKKWIN